MKWINRKIKQVIYLCFLYETSGLLNYDIFFDEDACNFKLHVNLKSGFK